MDAIERYIYVSTWIGLAVTTGLAVATLYFWTVWVVAQAIKHPWPAGLRRGIQVSIAICLTKKPSAVCAHLMAYEIAQAEKRSPEFAAEISGMLVRRDTLERIG